MSWSAVRGVAPNHVFRNAFVKRLCRYEFPLKAGNEHVTIEMCSPIECLQKVDSISDTNSQDYVEEVLRVVRDIVPKLSPDTAYDGRWKRLIDDTRQSPDMQDKFALGVVLAALSPVHADMCGYLARLDKRSKKLKRATEEYERSVATETSRRQDFKQLMLHTDADVENIVKQLTGLVNAEESVKARSLRVGDRDEQVKGLEREVPPDVAMPLASNPQYALFVRELLSASNSVPSRHARFVHVAANLVKGSSTAPATALLGLLCSSTSVAPVNFPRRNFGKLPFDCVAYEVVCGLFYHA
ncbi:hypothetical protein CYMTET_7904 [Cymbomonas tetramitiformis]|uniref:Uncharacterized protein n=1 Tax=Cymbomonas tetramitiformis TaxID=36881 RepID=A0AAE0GUI7_9CHLO|nr:hypothetical protein CYMTET_7904 [Cymbomonas tetramitiformis]